MQLTINIQNTQYGRTSQGLYQAEHPKGLILKLLSKRSQKLMFQCLIVESGQKQDTLKWLEATELHRMQGRAVLEENDQPSLGESLMPSIGEFPSVGVESSLWQVMEVNAPQKYYLSKRACEGIVRRAANRGKVLPPLLDAALKYRIATADLDANSDTLIFTPVGENEDGVTVYGLCSNSSNSMKSSNPDSGIYEADTIRTLDRAGGNPSCNQGGMIVVERTRKSIHESISGDSTHISDMAYALRSARIPIMLEQLLLHPSIVPTLTATAGGISRPGGGQGSELDYYVAYALQGNMIGRADKNGPQGDGINENSCFTLNTTDKHAVAFFNFHSADSRVSENDTASTQTARQYKSATDLVVHKHFVDTGMMSIKESDVANTQTARQHKGTMDYHVSVNADSGFSKYTEGVYGTLNKNGGEMGGGAETLVAQVLASQNEVTGTIMANCGDKLFLGNQEAFSGNYHIVELTNFVPFYIVRRLTPTECERLQGFPDDWTKFGADTDKQIADTPRYQMLGNSVAIPCVQFILGNIVRAEQSK